MGIATPWLFHTVLFLGPGAPRLDKALGQTLALRRSLRMLTSEHEGCLNQLGAAVMALYYRLNSYKQTEVHFSQSGG